MFNTECATFLDKSLTLSRIRVARRNVYFNCPSSMRVVQSLIQLLGRPPMCRSGTVQNSRKCTDAAAATNTFCVYVLPICPSLVRTQSTCKRCIIPWWFHPQHCNWSLGDRPPSSSPSSAAPSASYILRWHRRHDAASATASDAAANNGRSYPTAVITAARRSTALRHPGPVPGRQPSAHRRRPRG
jgi:hypothetical protein